jgi:hypothetical protein
MGKSYALSNEKWVLYPLAGHQKLGASSLQAIYVLNILYSGFFLQPKKKKKEHKIIEIKTITMTTEAVIAKYT